MGSWNASMDTGGTDNTPNGTPALTSGGGLATSGTNTTNSGADYSDTTGGTDRGRRRKGEGWK